jgi:hypothetical protein
LWGLVLIGSIPNILTQLLFAKESVQDPLSVNTSVGYWIFMFLNFLLFICLMGAVCFAAYRALRGEVPTFGECLARGFKRMPDVFLAAVLLALLFGFYISMALQVTIFCFMVLKVLGVLLGLAFVFLGAFLALKWYLAVPVCVIEKTGARESFKRAAELVRGNMVRLFVVLLLFGAIWAIIVLVCLVPMAMVGGRGPGYAAALIMTSVVSNTASVLIWVSLPVIYLHLRTVKENYSIVNEADVFD